MEDVRGGRCAPWWCSAVRTGGGAARCGRPSAGFWDSDFFDEEGEYKLRKAGTPKGFGCDAGGI